MQVVAPGQGSALGRFDPSCTAQPAVPILTWFHEVTALALPGKPRCVALFRDTALPR